MNKNIDLDLSRQLSITIRAESVSRRVVLKNALTVGCGMLLPVVLMGCGSDQSEGTNKSSSSNPATPATTPNTNATPPAAAATPSPGTSPPASTVAPVEPGKVSQASVQYQDQPKGDQNCRNCVLFIEPNACMVVEGVISPEGWSALWAPIAS